MERTPCERLWRAVLAQALTDLNKRDPKAIDWYLSKDFAVVCNLAGVEPDTVRRYYTRHFISVLGEYVRPSVRADAAERIAADRIAAE